MKRSFRLPLKTLRALVALPCLALLFVFPHTASADASSIAYHKQKVGNVVAHVVTINMNDLDVRLTPAMAKYGVGSSETFASMINRTRPTAAITGTFFDTKSLRPVGDIVVDGEMVCRGVVGTAVGIGWNNEVSFIPTKQGRVSNWSGFQSVLCAGPMLLSGGERSVYPIGEGFRDAGIYSRRSRAAVGLTKHHKLIFVTIQQPLYLSELSKVMKSLGARDAATLDGGSSTALYYRGTYIARPARQLTNLLLAYDCSSNYEQARQYLFPMKIKVVKGQDTPKEDG